MNMMTSNDLRTAVFAVLMSAGALVWTATQAADTPPTEHVTVQAERPMKKVIGETRAGEPIVHAELRHRVSYADLDLSIDSNAKVLKQRVHDAARKVCADLERLYPDLGGGYECARGAEEGGQRQVEAAIAAAQARKHARD